jgi:hypothetical protein
VPAGVAPIGFTLALILLLIGVAAGELSAATTLAGNHHEVATRFASGHSAILAVPYLVLAVMTIVERTLSPAPPPPPMSTGALTQFGLVFVSGLMLFLGMLTQNFGLIEANVPLVVAGAAIFLVRIGTQVFPSGWRNRHDLVWFQVCVLAMAADVGLFAHAMVEVGRRRYPSIELVPTWLLFAVDHLTYVAVASAALFGAVAAKYGADRRDVFAAWGMVAALLAAIAAIGVESPVVEGASMAVLAVCILTGAATGSRRVRRSARESL